MNVNQITCKHCGDEFDTKGKYDSHYRSKHQKKSSWIIGEKIKIMLKDQRMENLLVFVERNFSKEILLFIIKKTAIFRLRGKQMNQNLRMVFFYFQVN